MHTPVRGILKNLEQNDIKNIILFPYTTGFDSAFCDTGHNIFYIGNIPLNKPNCQNCSIQFINQIPLNLDINLIVLPYKPEFIQTAMQLSNVWHIPYCVVQHNMNVDKTKIDNTSHVFINDIIAGSCNRKDGKIINYGIKYIQNKLYTKRFDILLIDYENNYTLEHIINIIPSSATYKLVKYKDLSKQDFNDANIFINTLGNFSIAYEILEAMDSMCAIVTNTHMALQNILINNISACLANNSKELEHAINRLSTDKGFCRNIAASGKQMIIKEFSHTSFINEWNTEINKLCLQTIIR